MGGNLICTLKVFERPNLLWRVGSKVMAGAWPFTISFVETSKLTSLFFFLQLQVNSYFIVYIMCTSWFSRWFIALTLYHQTCIHFEREISIADFVKNLSFLQNYFWSNAFGCENNFEIAISRRKWNRKVISSRAPKTSRKWKSKYIKNMKQ